MEYITKDAGWTGYRLTSGKTFYANGGILGLGPDPDEFLSEGYDGGVSGEKDFTRDERREIASFMIMRWHEWGRRAP